MIERTEKNEADGANRADGDKEFAATFRLPTQHVAEAISRGHDEDPGNERIGEDHESTMKREAGDLMERIPYESEAAEPRGIDAVEQIMRGDDDEAERSENAYGKVGECGKKDH